MLLYGKWVEVVPMVEVVSEVVSVIEVVSVVKIVAELFLAAGGWACGPELTRS